MTAELQERTPQRAGRKSQQEGEESGDRIQVELLHIENKKGKDIYRFTTQTGSGEGKEKRVRTGEDEPNPSMRGPVLK